MKIRRHAFSLVEVVLALGVVSFAIVAILGLIPTGLQTSRSSQDETRAAHIAQSIFAAFSSQRFNAVTLLEYDATTGSQSGSLVFDLGSLNGSGPSWGANNSGELFVPGTPVKFLSRPSGPPANPADTGQTYSVTISFNNAPTGFDSTYANQLVVTIGWPASATPANQTKRDFIRVISKY